MINGLMSLEQIDCMQKEVPFLDASIFDTARAAHEWMAKHDALAITAHTELLSVREQLRVIEARLHEVSDAYASVELTSKIKEHMRGIRKLEQLREQHLYAFESMGGGGEVTIQDCIDVLGRGDG